MGSAKECVVVVVSSYRPVPIDAIPILLAQVLDNGAARRLHAFELRE